MLDRPDLADPSIVPGGAGDRQAVLAILTAAFAADPAARALYPGRAAPTGTFPGSPRRSCARRSPRARPT